MEREKKCSELLETFQEQREHQKVRKVCVGFFVDNGPHLLSMMHMKMWIIIYIFFFNILVMICDYPFQTKKEK